MNDNFAVQNGPIITDNIRYSLVYFIIKYRNEKKISNKAKN